MKKSQLLILFLLLNFSLSAQVQWDGGGDGTSWNDGLNWDGDVVPVANALVEFPNVGFLTVTGTMTNAPAQIKSLNGSKLTLNLNVNIGDGTQTVDGLQAVLDSKIFLGDGSTAISVNMNGPNNRDAISMYGANSTFDVAANATVTITGYDDAIFLTNDGATFTNDGIITANTVDAVGIRLTRGTFINNGTFNMSTTSAQIGVKIVNTFTSFTNNGTMNISKALNDAIESDAAAGTATNNGTLNLTAQDAANIGNQALVVLAGGTFTNSTTGIINADGGISANARAIVNNSTLDNFGQIFITNGNLGSQLRNISSGTITNHECALIDMTGRFYNFAGTFTNDGLIYSTHTGQGLLNGTGSTATNNAFYGYAGQTGFAAAGTVINNGINVNAPAELIVDAVNSCTVSDIGINVASDWYMESANINLVGSNTAAGTLTFNNGVFGPAGTQTIFNCFGTYFSMTVNNVNGDCTTMPLPVELISFNGEIKDQTVLLKWKTDSEINNKGFEIERSKNGRDWEMIGFEIGKGNSHIHQAYQYIDRHPLLGYNYYRLKQIDFDGNYEYSMIRSFQFNDKINSEVKVYPNPTNSTFNIRIQNPNQEAARLQIFNSKGQIIMEKYWSTNEMESVWEDVFFLKEKEIYFLMTQIGEVIKTEKISIVGIE